MPSGWPISLGGESLDGVIAVSWLENKDSGAEKQLEEYGTEAITCRSRVDDSLGTCENVLV
jgi:hypothetical protein